MEDTAEVQPVETNSQQPPDKLFALYNSLKKNATVKGLPDDYNKFKTVISDPVKAKAFHEALLGNETISGLPSDFEQFSNTLGLSKKKAQSAPSPQGSQSGSPTSGPQYDTSQLTNPGQPQIFNGATGDLKDAAVVATLANQNHEAQQQKNQQQRSATTGLMPVTLVKPAKTEPQTFTQTNGSVRKDKSWENLGDFIPQTVLGGLQKDAGQAIGFLGNILPKGPTPLLTKEAGQSMADFGARLEGLGTEKQQSVADKGLPETTTGTVVSGATHFAPDLIELAFTPELDVAKLGKIADVLGKYGTKAAQVATGKFPALMATKGLTGGYMDAKDKGATDYDATKEALIKSAAEYGKGALFEGAGKIAGKASDIGKKLLEDNGWMANGKIVAGAQKAILNSSAQATAFSAVPFITNAVQGKSTSLKELQDNAIFGGVLGLFHGSGPKEGDHTAADAAAQNVQERAPLIDLSNFANADMDAIKQVHDMPENAADLKIKSAVGAEQAFKAETPEEKQQAILQSSIDGKAASVKTVTEAILKDKDAVIGAVPDDLPNRQDLVDKINAVHKAIDPIEQQKNAMGAQITNIDQQIEAASQKSPDPVIQAENEVKLANLTKKREELHNGLKDIITKQNEPPVQAEDQQEGGVSETHKVISSDAKTALREGRKKQVVVIGEDGTPTVEEHDFNQDDADLELDSLEALAKKGKLTKERFQSSYFGQVTNSSDLQGAFREIESDPISFIKKIRKAFEGDENNGTSTNENIPTKEAVSPEQANSQPVKAVSDNAVPTEKTEDQKITINEVKDVPIVYNGESAVIKQDGQTLVAKIKGSNREYELGNADEIGDKSIKDFGIEHQNSVVDTHENGNILVRGKEYVNNYSDPKSAINYDKDGNVVSVNLETPDGGKRAFKGDVAEDIAYQIHLKELNKDNESKQQFEQFVEQHEPSKSAIVAGEDEVAAEKGAAENNEPVSRKPAKTKAVEDNAKPESPEAVTPTPKSDGKVETKTETEGQTDGRKEEVLNAPEKTAAEVPAPVFSSEEEADRHAIENETDPKKLAARYYTETSAPDYIEKGIIDYLGNSKINEADYERITGQKADGSTSRWLDKKNRDNTDINTHAEILSHELGVQVTPQDIVETIDRYKGRKNFEESNKTKTQRLLEDKYQELTGKRLTDRRAERAFNKLKKLSDSEREAFNAEAKEIGITEQDVDNYERFRKATEPGPDKRGDAKPAKDKVSKSKDEQSGGSQKDRGDKGVQSGSSLTDQEATRLKELRNKFAGQFNDVTRIITLLADKEFREYAGLIFKDTLGDFKAFSKRMIDEVGEKIKEHLPQLFKELGGKEPKEEPIGITKEETRKQREFRGLENLPQSEKKTLSGMFDSGKEAVDGNAVDPRKLAAEVSEKPRNLTPVEVNALLYDRQRIRTSLFDIHRELETKQAEPDHLQEASETLVNRQRFLEEALDNNERALRAGANQNALALVAMRNMINADYTHATQLARMRSLAGGKLTPEMEKEIDRYSKELEEANQKLSDYEKKFAELQAKKVYDKERVAHRKAGKAETKENLRAERKTLVGDFLKEMEKARKAGILSSDIPYRRELAIAAPFIKKMLTNLAKEGITEFKDVIATIHENFAEHIDGLKERDIMDVLAGKYNERKETKNELLDQKNAILKLSRLTTKLEDLKKGLESAKSEKHLVESRADIAKLEEEIKEIEKQHSEALRPERERQSYIKQLKKGISDIDGQIAAGEKTRPGDDKYADDAEINKLRDQRSAKQDELNEIDPSQKQQAELSAAIKATNKSISDIEERIAKKDLHPEKKEPKDYNSPELTRLREKRDALAKDLDQLKKDEFTPEERKKQSLQRQLDKINGRIQVGDFDTPEPKDPLSIDHEMITLQSKVKKAQNNFDAMAERLGNHSRTKMEKVLDTYTMIRRAMLLSGVKTLGKLYSFAALRSATTPIEEAINSINSRIPLLSRIAQMSPRFSKGFTMKAEAEAISTRWSKATLKDSWADVLKTGVGELDRVYGKHGVDKDFALNPSALEFFGRLHGAFKNSTKRAEFFRSFQKRMEYAAGRGLDINDPNVQFATALEAYADGKRAILMNDNILVDKGYKSLLRGLEMGGTLSGKTMATAIRALFPIVKIPTNYVLETYDAIAGATPLSRATPYIVKAMIKGADSLSPKQADMVMRTLVKGQIGLAAMIISYYNPQMFGGYYSGKRKDNDLKAGDIVIDGHVLPHWMAHNPYFEAMQVAATMRRAIDEANGNGAPNGIMDQLTTKRRDEISTLAQEKADKNNPNVQLVEVQDGKTFYEVYIKGDKVSSINKEGGVKSGVKNSVTGLSEQIPFTSVGDIVDNQKTTGNLTGEMARNQIEPRLFQEAAQMGDKDTKFTEHPIDYLTGDAKKRDPNGFVDQLKVGVPGLREQVAEKTTPADKKVSILKLKNGDQYPLNQKQIEERKALNTDYIKEHGQVLRDKLKNKGLTDHDIELKVQKIANKHSKNILWQKYKDQLQLKDDD